MTQVDIHDIDQLSSMYLSGMSIEKISSLINHAPMTVWRKFKKYGVRIRTLSEAQKSRDPSTFHRGSIAWNNKGGSINHSGYRRIHRDGRAIFEHRAILEDSIGRKLLPSEVVHHKNGNRLDNRIENLVLMNKSDHSSLHMTKERIAQNTAWVKDHKNTRCRMGHEYDDENTYIRPDGGGRMCKKCQKIRQWRKELR